MLSVGTHGSDVTRLQKQLKAAGFNPGSVDGVFGAKTKAAVIAYQKKKHLTADGVVGANTSQKLFGSSAKKYYDGKSDYTQPPAPKDPPKVPKEPGGTKGDKIASAAKDVASHHYKYVWGGGHGGSPGASKGRTDNPKTVADDAHTKGYDCSGFVREAV